MLGFICEKNVILVHNILIMCRQQYTKILEKQKNSLRKRISYRNSCAKLEADFTYDNKYIQNDVNSIQKQLFKGVLKKKVFWKYAANLQEKTHAEVWFQQSWISCWIKLNEVAAYLQNTFLPFPKNSGRLKLACSTRVNIGSEWSKVH